MRITEKELRKIVRDMLREADDALGSQGFVGPLAVKGPGSDDDPGFSKEEYCDALASQLVSLTGQLSADDADVHSIQGQIDMVTKTQASKCK